MLQWIFSFLACHNSVDKEVPESGGEIPPEGCVATYNDLMHHLLLCDMVSKSEGVTAAVVARAFQDATGQEVHAVHVHPSNK